MFGHVGSGLPAHFRDGAGRRHEFGVCRHYARDIGPYFKPGRLGRGSIEGGAEVGTATPQSRALAVIFACYEAWRHKDTDGWFKRHRR